MDITVDELRRILIANAGEPEVAVPAADFADTSFEDLGYESLALIESAAAIEREYGVVIPEDSVFLARTPRELAAAVRSAQEAA